MWPVSKLEVDEWLKLDHVYSCMIQSLPGASLDNLSVPDVPKSPPEVFHLTGRHSES